MTDINQDPELAECSRMKVQNLEREVAALQAALEEARRQSRPDYGKPCQCEIYQTCEKCRPADSFGD